jgi:hypothetical protein
MLRDILPDLLDEGAAPQMPADDLLDAIRTALSQVPPLAIERAAALYVWKRTWESLLPASRHGGDRRSARYTGQDQSEKIAFCSVAATAVGLSERAIQLDIALAEKLGAAAIRRLWTSPIADNGVALRAVSELAPLQRESLFSIWVDNPALGFAAAMQAAKLRARADADEGQFLSLVTGWQRAGSKARRRFLVHLGADEAAVESLIGSWQKRGAR